MFVERTYRKQFNTGRFKGFEIKYKETDLWIGVDPASYKTEMKEFTFLKIKSLREKFDSYISEEPFFKKTLKPFQPAEDSPPEAREMAAAAEQAGVGPMATVAALFARKTGEELLRTFTVKEMIIENGGDIFAFLNKELVLSVFAGDSPLSERIGLAIPNGMGKFGICTSAGTVGPSFSAGKSDAVVVICENILLADAYATAFGNKVKSPEDVEKVINDSEKVPEIISMLIICEDKIGIRGEFEIRVLK